MNKIPPERFMRIAQKAFLSLDEAAGHTSGARWLIQDRLYYGASLYEEKARKRINEALTIAENAIKTLKYLNSCVLDYEDTSELQQED